jgi:hypothetical protein
MQLLTKAAFYNSIKTEDAMRQMQTITLDERIAIRLKALEFEKQGKTEEYERTMKSMPMPPFLAKFAKDYLGADFLTEGGWNLAEADLEYGPGWLNK